MVGQADGRRPPHRHPARGPHTASLSGQSRQRPSPAAPADQRRKISTAPQTQLCAFTDRHCVAHSNTCTYFSMASLASTTRSLSAHMSCVLLESESGNHRAQERAQRASAELRPLLGRHFKSAIRGCYKQHMNNPGKKYKEKCESLSFSWQCSWRLQAFEVRRHEGRVGNQSEEELVIKAVQVSVVS